MDKTKNLETLKLDIINSVSELSAISEENAASNEEVTARVTEIAESVNRISEDTQTAKIPQAVSAKPYLQIGRASCRERV
mgnify:CR=1 FL=1